MCLTRKGFQVNGQPFSDRNNTRVFKVQVPIQHYHFMSNVKYYKAKDLDLFRLERRRNMQVGLERQV
jgi:hypothetical protein